MMDDIKEAITFLEEERGFNVTDLSEFKWKIEDEEISFSVKTDKELIDYANDQYDNMCPNCREIDDLEDEK